MPTFFDGKKSFADVSVVNSKVDTAAFLEASEALVKLFDLLGSTAFAVVQKDMSGNIEKVRSKLLADPENCSTLQDLILSEAGTKSKNATQGLLWLVRGLQFTAQAMRNTVDDPSAELKSTFTAAYDKTLSKYHTFVIKPIFKMAMMACPYRKNFFEKLGDDQAKVNEELARWLKALEEIVDIIMDFFALGDYGKGL